MNARDDATQSLTELGFTALESETYVLLLREAPATGHAVARGLGKANANVYKALEALESKGAVIAGDAEPRLYRPVPVAELLDRIERESAARRRRVKRALSGIERVTHDDGIYRMANPGQVLERARRLVDGAEFAVLADGDAPLLEELESELEAAAGRDVHVLVKAYRELELTGARVVFRPRPEEITAHTPGTFAVLAADGREFLLSRFAPDGEVQQAIWTASPMLAFQGYMGLINELTLTEMMRGLESDASVEELRRTFERDRPLHPISSRNPVYRHLMRALGQAPTRPEHDSQETR